MRSARCLRRRVVVGASTKPAAVAVPVTCPTRESEGETGGEDGLCNSCTDKLEKSNSGTMSCPLKVRTDTEQWCACICIMHTCLEKNGTVVWGSSLVFASKVFEVNSLGNRHQMTTCKQSHFFCIILGVHPNTNAMEVDKVYINTIY